MCSALIPLLFANQSIQLVHPSTNQPIKQTKSELKKKSQSLDQPPLHLNFYERSELLIDGN